MRLSPLTDALKLDSVASNNGMEGSIPPQLGECKSLERLYDNFFSATFSLHARSLNLNKYDGSIPATLGNLVGLQYLYVMSLKCGVNLCRYINNNKLIGSIPMELGKLSNLQWL